MKYTYLFLTAILFICGCVETQQRNRFVQHVIEVSPLSRTPDYSAMHGLTIPTHCDGMPQNIIAQCEMAKNFQITIREANEVLSLSGAEVTASLCGFNRSDNFESLKNMLLLSPQRKQAYLYMANFSDQARTNINNIRVFCNDAYRLHGPEAPPPYYRLYK